MDRCKETTVELVFTDDRFVSLNKVSDILSTSMLRVKEVVAGVVVSEGYTTLTCNRYVTQISVEFREHHTSLFVSIRNRAGVDMPRQTQLAHLAFLCFPLALNLPATYLLWPGFEVRIPRQRFIDGLAKSFAPLGNESGRSAEHSPENTPDRAPETDSLRDSIRRNAHVGLQPATEETFQPTAERRSMLSRIAAATRPVFGSVH